MEPDDFFLEDEPLPEHEPLEDKLELIPDDDEEAVSPGYTSPSYEEPASLDNMFRGAWRKFKNQRVTQEGDEFYEEHVGPDADDADLLREAYDEFLGLKAEVESRQGTLYRDNNLNLLVSLAKIEYHLNANLGAAEQYAQEALAELQGYTAPQTHEAAFLLAGMYLTEDRFQDAKTYAKLARQSLGTVGLSEERRAERENTLKRIIRHSAREQGGIKGFVNKAWYGVNGDISGFDTPRSGGIRGYFVGLFADDIHEAFPYLMSQDDFDFWCDRAVQDELGTPIIDLCKDVVNYAHGLAVFDNGEESLYLRDDLSSIAQGIEAFVSESLTQRSGEESAHRDVLFKKALVTLAESYLLDLKLEEGLGTDRVWDERSISNLANRIGALSVEELHQRYEELYVGTEEEHDYSDAVLEEAKKLGKRKEHRPAELETVLKSRPNSPLRKGLESVIEATKSYDPIDPANYDWDDKKRSIRQRIYEQHETEMWRGAAQETYDLLTYGVPVFGTVKLIGSGLKWSKSKLPSLKLGVMGYGCLTAGVAYAAFTAWNNLPWLIGGALSWGAYKGIEATVEDPVKNLKGGEKLGEIMKKVVLSYPIGLVGRPVKAALDVFTQSDSFAKRNS